MITKDDAQIAIWLAYCDLKADYEQLRQERDQLKVSLLRFLTLDSHDPDLTDDLWCLQQEESPLINPDSVYKKIAEHDAEVIESALYGLADSFRYEFEGCYGLSEVEEFIHSYANQLRQKAQED